MFLDKLKKTSNNILQTVVGSGEESSVEVNYSEDQYKEILDFESPLFASLISDCSNSVSGSKLAHIKDSSTNLVNDLEGTNTPIGLITFGRGVKVETPLTKKTERIKEKIRAMSASGGTPFYKAMLSSYDYHLKKATNERVMIIDTDGLPSFNSERTILNLGDKLKEDGITIITIGIGKDVNKSFLRKLASTPGDYYFAEAPKDIRKTFEEVTGSLVRKL